MAAVVLLSSLFVVTRGHSWLECSKYGNANVDPPLDGKSYDINKCAGFGRNFEQTFGPKSSHTFGIDRGYNVQPGTNYCNGRTVKATASYPKANYVAGEKVRLVWPAKNHDAEACTNPFIPDTAMKIYATMSTATNGPATLGDKTANLQSSWRLIADFKTQADQIGGKTPAEGFQRCPDFCGSRGTDKAICFQDMQVPTNLPAGDYIFLWYWIFNQGSGAYTTCFDVTVTSGGGTTTAPQTTIAPGGATSTSSGTASPTALIALRLQIKNTGGIFDQQKLIATIRTQLSKQECEIVTLSFSGGNTNGVNTFTGFFGVSMQEKDYAAAKTKTDSMAFSAAITNVTGGSNNIIATKDGPVTTSCTTTTTSITRYTISMVVNVAYTPTPLAGSLSSALNQTVVDNGAKGDVSCILQSGQTKTFVCVVVVFSVNDVITVSNMASQNNGAAVKAGLANNLKVSGGSATAAQFVLSGTPSNVQQSTSTTGSPMSTASSGGTATTAMSTGSSTTVVLTTVGSTGRSPRTVPLFVVAMIVVLVSMCV